jgi:hypothetical protein
MVSAFWLGRILRLAVVPSALVGLALAVGGEGRALATPITGGSMTLLLTEGKANSISVFNAYFDAATTSAACLADPAPGNEAFTRPTGGTVLLSDPIRPGGVIPTPVAGRAPQQTTLDVDPTDVLGGWTTSSNDGGAFVGSTTLGDQIAMTSMQRWTGPFTGSILYGDFALRYTGTELALTSNIDFLNAVWATIGTPQVSVLGNTLTIEGDLLIGGALNLLDPSAVVGTKFGDFSLTASLTATPVPEIDPVSLPSVLAMVGGSLTLLERRRVARAVAARAVV